MKQFLSNHLFLSKLLEGLQGNPNVVTCAFVKSDVTEASYFATPFQLGVS
jgi:hypothetical protein